MSKKLVNKIDIGVRFSEVDSMLVVWHGNYVKFLEDGREAWGKEFGLGYYDVYAHQFMTPVVKLDMDYKRMVKYGEAISVETEYVYTEAAKIQFNYTIRNKNTNEVVLTAKSVQVFINSNYELQMTNPDFYLDWQKKMGLLS